MKIILLLLVSFLFVLKSPAQFWVYDCPDGDLYRSPDYEVYIIQNSDTLESFTYYSYGKSSYTRYNWQHEAEETRSFNHKGPARHSTSIFSFSDSVTVRVKVLNNAKHITLPLTSAKILPSSYNIPCEVKEGNIIEFTLDRPEKIAVMPNFDAAWEVYEQRGIGHIPITSWKSDYSKEKNKSTYHGVGLENRLSECYQNPLFLFAHAPEKRIPDSTSSRTLYVKPGDLSNQNTFSQYDTVWFAPGVHDMSDWGTFPWFQVKVNKGQTFYLEGGAYLKARLKGESIGQGPSAVVGRGIISGIEHKWIRSSDEGSQVISIDSLIGVTITDRACFGTYGGRYIGDVGMVGAWHGNTDGPDYTKDCLIENCFLVAHDDNLKLNDNTQARHCVLWQGTNAHPIMVKEIFHDGKVFQNSIVEDIDIIGYFTGTDWDNPWPQVSRAAISIVQAQDVLVTNFTFRDIRIESPYLSRVLNIYNLNTNSINPGWFNTTTESYHSKVNGVYFDNISVNAPVIGYQSLLGAGYDNTVKNVCFSNLTINGTKVTSANHDDFFEIESNRVENVSFYDGDTICQADPDAEYISVLSVGLRDCPSSIVKAGETVQLSAIVAPEDASDKSVTWSSSNTSVATVDEKGLVTALSQGSVKITVKSNDGANTDACSLGVFQPLVPVTGVTVDNCPKDTLYVNTSHQLSATVYPENASNKVLSWSSSDQAVLAVDDSGLITVLAAGTAEISVKTEDGSFEDKCAVVSEIRSNSSNMSNQISGVRIFPNPARDALYLEFSKADPNRVLKIYNSEGQMIFEQKASGMHLYLGLSKLNVKGLLMVHLIGGKEESVHKVSILP